MASIAYNISPRVRRHIRSSEELLTKLLTSPLSPQDELRNSWGTTIERVFYSSKLTGMQLTKDQIARLLTLNPTPPIKVGDISQDLVELVNYKSAIDYIHNEWVAANKPISLDMVKTLYDIACLPTKGEPGQLYNSRLPEIKAFLQYIQAGNEHPIIQAAIAHIQILLISPFTVGNGTVARLLGYLFMANQGYTFRKMLTLEEFFFTNLENTKEVRDIVKKSQNFTLWIEYYTWGIAAQLKKSVEKVERNVDIPEIPVSFWKLNKRQKEIVNKLQNPDMFITNKDVQTSFGVSQITASRDLAKLAKLGIVVQKGKGRSTYYIKI